MAAGHYRRGRLWPHSAESRFLELAPQGCLNVHYSLLPKYRGAAPAAWTIINGETEGGVTTMKLVEKMDAGVDLSCKNAIATRRLTKPAGSLQAKLTPIGATSVARNAAPTQSMVRLAPREQDESLATVAPILKKEDGLIDWQRPAIRNRAARARPRPVARQFYAFLRGKTASKFIAPELSSAERRGESRRNRPRRCRPGFWVATASGVIEPRRSAAGKQEAAGRRRVYQGRKDQTR